MNPERSRRAMRYAILAAVSTKEQARDDKTSLENQEKDARAAALAKGWVESAGPYRVPGHSRTRYINLRDAEREIPALRGLLDSASQGKYDVLVMADHDRFRSLLRAVYQALSDYRVQLYSLAQPVEPVPPGQFDPYENDSAEMYIGISEIRSAAEISRMRRKYRSGMRDRVRKHGLPVQLPYGYEYPPRVKRNDKPVPVQIPDRVPYLVELKKRFLKGQSLRQLIDYLDECNLPPPRSPVWHPDTVRNILKNPFYAGIVRFEVTKVKKDRRHNIIKRDRSQPEKAITNTGAHEPLWSLDEHRAILAEFERRSRPTGNYQGRKNNQFTGLLKCGECGASLWRFKNGPRSVPDRLVWRCSENTSEHTVVAHVDLLEKVGTDLLESLRPYLEHREIPQREIAEPPPGPSLEQLKAELYRLETAYQKGRYSEEHYEPEWLKLHERIRAIEESDVIEAQRQAERQSRLDGLSGTLGPHLHELPVWLAEHDQCEVNRVLHILLEKIVVIQLKDDWKVELFYK